MSSIARNRDSSIDVTPTVRSLDQTASSLAYKQDNVLALLYIALGWTKSGAGDKSPT